MMSEVFLRARGMLRRMFRRRELEHEMQAEMRQHLDLATERFAKRGLSPERAREAAAREFGSIAFHQEEGRDARGLRWIESVVADLRFAVRHFARKPLASITIVAVLAVGIGVHSALFAVFQAITQRAAPGVESRADLVRLRGKEQPRRGDRWYSRGFSYPEFRDLSEQRQLFTLVAGWTSESVTLESTNSDDAQSARVQFIAGPFFETVGVRAAVGTLIHPSPRVEAGDDERVAVLSHALWHGAFGGAPDVVGRVVRVNDVAVRVIGVAAPDFNGAVPTPGAQTLWMPLSARNAVMRSDAQSLFSRDTSILSAIARLAPGVTIERADGVVRVLAARAAAQMAPLQTDGMRDADVVPLSGDTELPADTNGIFLVLVLGVGAALILVLACTNVSALVVGAGIARRQEITVRLSLGASRARIVRQLVTESCLLAVAGGLLGLVIFASVTRVLATQYPEMNLAPDFGTVAFTLLFALGTGVVFGLSPALHATRRDLASVLKSSSAGATGRSRLQSAFVVVQIAVTQPLLVGLCLVLLLAIQDGGATISEDLTNHLIRARFDLDRPTPRVEEELRAAMRDLTSMPGVAGVVREAVGIALVDLTIAADSDTGAVSSDAPVSVHVEATSPGYFALLDVPMVRGRELEASDSSSRDLAVVIGSDLALRLWHGQDPIGKRLTQTTRGRVLDRRAVVVGVFDARKQTTRGAELRVFAIRAGARRDHTYLVRTSEPAAAMVKPLRAHMREAMPRLAVGQFQTFADIIANGLQEVRVLSSGVTAATLAALFLASLGLYGVVGLAVAQRNREIGIRMALGARAGEVVMLLFRVGLRLAVLGLLIGLPLSVAVLQLVSKEIGTGAVIGNAMTSAPIIGLLVAVTVLIVAATATWIPARRAAHVEPMIALRAE
ncbi:MAG: ABC transporter permease [Gemmatimonadota bacterium]